MARWRERATAPRSVGGSNCERGRSSASGHRRESLAAAHIVDDFEHPRVQSRVLDSELPRQTAPVYQVVPGVLTPALLGEGDLGVREESAHDVGQLAEADGNAAR